MAASISFDIASNSRPRDLQLASRGGEPVDRNKVGVMDGKASYEGSKGNKGDFKLSQKGNPASWISGSIKPDGSSTYKFSGMNSATANRLAVALGATPSSRTAPRSGIMKLERLEARTSTLGAQVKQQQSDTTGPELKKLDELEDRIQTLKEELLKLQGKAVMQNAPKDVIARINRLIAEVVELGATIAKAVKDMGGTPVTAEMPTGNDGTSSEDPWKTSSTPVKEPAKGGGGGGVDLGNIALGLGKEAIKSIPVVGTIAKLFGF